MINSVHKITFTCEVKVIIIAGRVLPFRSSGVLYTPVTWITYTVEMVISIGLDIYTDKNVSITGVIMYCDRP